MTGPRVLPPVLAERVRAYVAAGQGSVPARPAATVVLVRDGEGGVEVYVQRRHATMPFAAGMLAFPGGRVDPVDLEPGDGDDAAWAARLGTDHQAARGFVRAALRELAEETGLELRPSDLLPWARWVTPRFEPRRYDTWFFLAGLPSGQLPQDVSGEAESVAWVRPADEAARAWRGESLMLPPTRLVLEELAGLGTVAAAVAAADGRVIETILPGWVDDGTEVSIVLPGDDGYPGDDPGDPA